MSISDTGYSASNITGIVVGCISGLATIICVIIIIVQVCKSKKSSPVFPGNQPYSGAYPAYPMAPPQYYNGYPPPYNSQTKRPPNSGPQQQNTGLRQQRQNTDLRQQRQNTNRDTDPDYFGERQNSSVSGVTAPQQWDYGAPMPSVSE